MLAARPRRLVSAATVEAILAAAGRSESVPAETIEGLREWLGAALERALWRLDQAPLTKPEVRQLRGAFDKLQRLAEPLRHRTDPPPRIDIRRWEEWFGAQDADRKRGRPNECDWILIGDLLAIYEVISGLTASGTHSEHSEGDNPTRTYLKTALGLLKSEMPIDSGIRFHVPSHDSLIDQLPKIRDRDIDWPKLSLN